MQKHNIYLRIFLKYILCPNKNNLTKKCIHHIKKTKVTSAKGLNLSTQETKKTFLNSIQI